MFHTECSKNNMPQENPGPLTALTWVREGIDEQLRKIKALQKEVADAHKELAEQTSEVNGLRKGLERIVNRKLLTTLGLPSDELEKRIEIATSVLNDPFMADPS